MFTSLDQRTLQRFGADAEDQGIAQIADIRRYFDVQMAVMHPSLGKVGNASNSECSMFIQVGNAVGRRLTFLRIMQVSSVAMLSVAGLATTPAVGDGLLLPAMVQSPAGLPEYRLGTMDRVRVKIVAWRPARDEVFEWKALNGEYTVGASGKLALPLIGEVDASGTTTAELGRLIADGLKNRIGLAERPDAAVEVVSFRPFYIVGDVNAPGEYAFRPGMSVIQALTIAGGMFRKASSDGKLERDSVDGPGAMDELVAERTMFVVRRARLDAELNGHDKIDVSALGVDAANRSAKSAIEIENRILKSRLDGFKIQLDTLFHVRSSHLEELDSLKGQAGNQEGILDLISRNNGSVEDLFKKKIVTQPRFIDSQRSLAQTKGDSMKLHAIMAGAAREISKAEGAIIAFRTTAKNELLLELATTNARIENIDRKIVMTRRLVSEAQKSSPRFGAVALQYVIVRGSGSGLAEYSASEESLINPGDTIKVMMITDVDAPSAEQVKAELLGAVERRAAKASPRGG